jgi:hypothetical protein
MSSPATLLNDLLRAFSSGGPGVVRLTATAAPGTRIPEERLFQLVIPTWGASTNQLMLPAPDPGKIVVIAGSATGGDLRTTSPNAISINGAPGQGASAKSAVAANQMVVAICESSVSWKAFTIAQAGTVAALAPAS